MCVNSAYNYNVCENVREISILLICVCKQQCKLILLHVFLQRTDES
jgi:hypothetical protein